MNMLHFPSAILVAVAIMALLPALAVAVPTKPVPAPHEGYLNVNGVRLHYVEQGEGKLVLLLHGFPEFWYAWKDVLPDLGQDHHVVAIDMRGYNLSSMPASVDDYKIPVLVEDVRAVAQHFGADASSEKKFVLVGHDWGGAVAWQFAYAHPELIDKLVILNAPHPAVFAQLLASNSDQQNASQYFNLFASPQAEQMLANNDFAFLQSAVFLNWATDQDKQKYLECWHRGLTGGLNYYRAAGLQSPFPQQAADAARAEYRARILQVPTLVIWGMKDHALLPANLDGMSDYVKTLKIERFPDASHWVGQEQPKAVSDAIREFIR